MNAVTNETVSALLRELYETTPGNPVPSHPIHPELAGLLMYDRPFFGVADAADPIFKEYQKLGVIGPWHKLPTDWLPEAKTVISVVFPFSEELKASNRAQDFIGSIQWMYARSDGQKWQNLVMKGLKERLTGLGAKCYIPTIDGGWRSYNHGQDLEQYPGTDENTYSSSWSERHAAYAAGLGTFSLTKGFITEKGIAVRFSSIVTDLDLTVTPRTCTGIYDNCTMCGACIKRCPVSAISFEKGKLHYPCNQHGISHKCGEYFGCGLCLTGVPCESRNPARK